MKLLSFLGVGKYEPTVYTYEGKEMETCYIVEALTSFFPEVERILVVLTPTAETPPPDKINHWQEVQKRLGDKVLPLRIPESHSEKDLWEIFNCLTRAVEEEDEVIFDITHSFRSLPFLTFLAIAYLRSVRRVQVRKVLYGAFEAPREGRTPVFDLTPFVSLLDWLNATNQFIYTGNARYLARQLQKYGHSDLHKLADTIDEIALGLQLLRPQQVSEAALRLPAHLATVAQILPPPFTLLSNRLVHSYSQFGLPPQASPHEQLRCQLAMINWYHQTRQPVHVLSLGREWLISLLCAHFEVDAQDKDEREEMELLLSGGKLKDPETGETIRISKYLDHWHTVPHGKRLRNLWSNPPYQLASLRNDVLHSGFRKNPRPAQDIVALVEEIVQELNDIAAQWGIVEPA